MKTPKAHSLRKTEVSSKATLTQRLLAARIYSGSQDMRWQFFAKRLAYDAYILQDSSIRLSAKNIWVNPFLESSTKIGNIEFYSSKSQDFSLDVQGSLLDLKINASVTGDASLLFNGAIGIDRKSNDIFFDMNTLNFTHPKTQTDIRLKQRGQFRFSDEEFLANKIHFVVAPKGEVQLDGVLRPEHVALRGWWKDIDLKYLPMGYDGYLLGRFNFEGTSKRPTGSLDIRLQDFKMPGFPPLSLDVKGSVIAGNPIHKLALAVNLLSKGSKPSQDAEIKIEIPMESVPRFAIAEELPIKGTVKYDGTLASLWQYVPLDGRTLSGNLLVDGKLSGPLSRPVVKLKAKIEKARYEDIITGILLTDINALFDLNPEGEATVLFAASDIKSGTIDIQGNIVLPWLSNGKYQAPVKIAGEIPTKNESNQIQKWEKSLAVVDLSSTIKKLQPLQRTDVQVMLSGDVKIRGMMSDPSVTGVIHVDEGAVHLENIQVASIPKLNIVESVGGKKHKARRNQGDFDLTLSIANKFYVLGDGIDSEWAGKIHVIGKMNNPVLSGNIAATRGRMEFLGKTFTLDKGEVSFDGSTPIAPIINVQLGFQAQEIEAKIGLSGTLQTPKLELSSIPHLPEDEVLSRILFSSSVSELSSYEKIRLGVMLANVAGFSLNTGSSGLVRKLFGIDVIRIGTSERNVKTNVDSYQGDSLYIELGKYLWDNVYVGVEQGLDNQETLGITSIELDNNLSIGAKAGTEESEVNFEWSLDY